MLGAAFAAGLCSEGVETTAVGVVPTGLISHAVRSTDASLGGVITASHNPAQDNGIKLFSSQGEKLSAEQEARVVQLLDGDLEEPETGGARLLQSRDPIDAYLDWLANLAADDLSGFKIVIDSSHGAAYEIAPKLFERLGASISKIGSSPDGLNINQDCGATHPSAIQAAVTEQGADLGIAFDGDADRTVFAASDGTLINGDLTMAIIAQQWARKGALDPRSLVGTVMSNGGFEAFLNSMEIKLERASVGDKYVSQRLVETGGLLGGEQSGHLIFPQSAPTGDGLLTALMLIQAICDSGSTSSDLAHLYEPWPQLLINIESPAKEQALSSEQTLLILKQAEEALRGRGRVNVRPSGTQPLIRVMVEADSCELRDEWASKLTETIIGRLGGRIMQEVDLTYALGD
jgi:phosphoglucosamine mutase